MEIDEIKVKMAQYRDFYGGDLIDVDNIRDAKSKEELSEIINRHISFMESMLCDALSDIERFRKEVGL